MSTARLNWHCICKIPCPLLPGLFLKTATPSRRTRAPASCQGQLSTRSWSRSSWKSSKSWGPARTWRAGGACSRCSRRIGWDDRTTRNTRAGPNTTSCSKSWPTDRSKVRIQLRSRDFLILKVILLILLMSSFLALEPVTSGSNDTVLPPYCESQVEVTNWLTKLTYADVIKHQTELLSAKSNVLWSKKPTSN